MSKRLHACLWLLLIMLAGANVLLIRQNLQMRRTIKGLEPQRLKAGERVQPFTAPGMNGEPVEVSYRGAGPKQVLLFLTPTCTYCQQQAPYWRELLARIDAARFEVIGLADQNEDRTKLQDYLSKIKPEPGADALSASPLSRPTYAAAISSLKHLSPCWWGTTAR